MLTNGTTVLYAAIVCTIIGKTFGGAYVLQGQDGARYVADHDSLTLM